MNRTILRAAGAIGALFNAAGVQSYLAYVGVLGSSAPPPSGEPAMPAAITAAFAIAVFGGVIGSIGLLLLKSWARPVLWLAFVGSVVDWGWVLTNSSDASVPLGVTIIVVSLVLALLGEQLSKVSSREPVVAAR